MPRRRPPTLGSTAMSIERALVIAILVVLLLIVLDHLHIV